MPDDDHVLETDDAASPARPRKAGRLYYTFNYMRKTIKYLLIIYVSRPSLKSAGS